MPWWSADGAMSPGVTSLKVAGSVLNFSSAACTLAGISSGETIGASRSLIRTT
jgi:hypothetical protein